jgi:hypothetical protein
MPGASVTPSTTEPESSSTAADSIFSPLPMKFLEEPFSGEPLFADFAEESGDKAE